MRSLPIGLRVTAVGIVGYCALHGLAPGEIQAPQPALAAAPASRGEIVHNGIANAVIVTPAKPLPVELYAASELAEHISLATGVKLSVISEDSAEASAGMRIYVGRCRATESAGIIAPDDSRREGTAVVAQSLSIKTPDTLEWDASLESWVVTNREPLNDSLEFTVDLGKAAAVGSFTFRNRPDAASNYGANRLQIAVGSRDDGQTFDEVVYRDTPRPGLNDAAVRREVDIKDCTKRFFRFRILSNLWGATGSTVAEAQSVFLRQLSYQPPAAKETVAGAGVRLKALPPNSYLVKTTKQGLFLVGRDDDGPPLQDTVQAGTLFAAYEWLDRQLGVRWLWPGELGTTIPKVKNVVAGNWNLRSKPPFIHTRLRQTVGRTWQVPSTGGFSAADRAAVIRDESVWYRRQRFARGISLDYDHAFHRFWGRFGKTHPEYFNQLPDGTRRPPGGNGETVSMSVGDKGFQHQVIEDWKEYRTGFQPWIEGAENDANGMCVCPDCLRMDVPDPALKFPWQERVERSRRAFLQGDRKWTDNLGSVSDRYARFWLELQKLGQATDPNVKVVGYAYANYWQPPRRTKLNENIVIAIVPDFWWPMNDKTAQSFKNQWNGWADAGASLYYRPNYLLAGYNQPVVFPHRVARDFSLAARRGLIATDFDSLTSMWATQGPNIYVLSRLHWHPQWSADRILDEYYSAFGPAKQAVKRYFDFWEQKTDERAESWRTLRQKYEHDSEMAIYQRIAGELFSPEYFATAEHLLAEARRAAGKDELALRRVQFLETGLEDARLSAAATAAYWKAKDGDNPASYAGAVQELDRYRRRPGAMKNVTNIDVSGWLEDLSWDRVQFSTLAEHKVIQQLPLDWQLRFDPEKRGLNEKWFADFLNTQNWQSIKTNAPWENQPAGKAWEKEHKAGYDGWAWYRLKFRLPANAGAKPALLFGAVDESATVWLNGRKVGEHRYIKPNDWQTPFTIDIAEAVNRDGDNELSVLVEDNAGAGGVYKPVWLIDNAERNTAGD